MSLQKHNIKKRKQENSIHNGDENSDILPKTVCYIDSKSYVRLAVGTCFDIEDMDCSLATTKTLKQAQHAKYQERFFRGYGL